MTWVDADWRVFLSRTRALPMLLFVFIAINDAYLGIGCRNSGRRGEDRTAGLKRIRIRILSDRLTMGFLIYSGREPAESPTPRATVEKVSKS